MDEATYLYFGHCIAAKRSANIQNKQVRLLWRYQDMSSNRRDKLACDRSLSADSLMQGCCAKTPTTARNVQQTLYRCYPREKVS